jgi:hypothetical protein
MIEETPSPEPQINMTPAELKFVVGIGMFALETDENQVNFFKLFLNHLKTHGNATGEEQEHIARLESLLSKCETRHEEMEAMLVS